MTGMGDPARLWIAIFALFELHNAEEIVRDLPAWGRAHMPGLTGLTLGRPGFAAVIAKPYHSKELARVVRRVLDQSDAGEKRAREGSSAAG